MGKKFYFIEPEAIAISDITGKTSIELVYKGDSILLKKNKKCARGYTDSHGRLISVEEIRKDEAGFILAELCKVFNLFFASKRFMPPKNFDVSKIPVAYKKSLKSFMECVYGDDKENT